MKVSLPAAVVSIACMITVASAADVQQTPGSKITISACTAKLPSAPVASSGTDANGHPTQSVTQKLDANSGLTIAYTNDASQAATEIDFAFVSGKRTIASAKDVGSFAPGTHIKHRFAIPGNVSVLDIGRGRCTVTSVTYADGTHWQAQ